MRIWWKESRYRSSCLNKHIAYISIGSNLGDRLANCRRGIAGLTQPGVSALKGQSRFYRSEPVDYVDQDWFVNAVVQVETSLDPNQLLDRLKQIEIRAGRKRDQVRFGPRVLDLDLLLYDDLVIDSPDLAIPHPRMHKRRFVLLPFCDIDPAALHPALGKEMRHLLAGLDKRGQALEQLR